jgi:hypothetical protein
VIVAISADGPSGPGSRDLADIATWPLAEQIVPAELAATFRAAWTNTAGALAWLAKAR